MRMRRNAGFSIIEFVLIVGVLAVVVIFGIPRYKVFRAKASQSDARANLTLIDKLQHGYHFNNETYSKSLKEIKFAVRGKQLYRYRIVKASADGYVAEAIAAKGSLADCAGEDRWQIDQTKNITNVKNGLAACQK